MTQYVKNLLSDSTVVNQCPLASKKCMAIVKILYLKYQSFLSLLVFLRFPSKNEACAIKSSYLAYTLL